MINIEMAAASISDRQCRLRVFARTRGIRHARRCAEGNQGQRVSRRAWCPPPSRSLPRAATRSWSRRKAGVGAGISDDDYRTAGAEIAASAEPIFERAELIVKVKEPLASERRKLRRGQVLFTYLHLAPDPEQAKDLMARGRCRHRLRDGDRRARQAAAAHADVGGGRAHGGAGRRAISRAAARRARHPARRRAGRGARRRAGDRRGRGRQQCRADRRRHGRRW